MKKKNKIKRDVRNLVLMGLQLEKYGGPEKNGDLFEEYLFLIEKILKGFGLPDSNKYEKILFFKSLPSDNDIKTVIKKLKTMASDYLLTPPKTEIQLLQEAIDLNLDIDNVLPELGISPHVYTHFVYNEILLKKLDNPESVLESLRRANKSKYLNVLGKLVFTKQYGEDEKKMLQYLNTKGIKYLDIFLPNFKID